MLDQIVSLLTHYHLQKMRLGGIPCWSRLQHPFTSFRAGGESLQVGLQHTPECEKLDLGADFVGKSVSAISVSLLCKLVYMESWGGDGPNQAGP